MHFSVGPWEFIKSVRLRHWLAMAEGLVDDVVAATLTEIEYKENLYFVQAKGGFD